MNSKNVAILGASKNPERYSNIAQKLLKEKGYIVFPINPGYEKIYNAVCYKSISDIKENIGTLTVYMNPDRLQGLIDEIIKKKPDRIILNPGSESEIIKEKFVSKGIAVIEACTLVLLKTGQF